MKEIKYFESPNGGMVQTIIVRTAGDNYYDAMILVLAVGNTSSKAISELFDDMFPETVAVRVIEVKATNYINDNLQELTEDISQLNDRTVENAMKIVTNLFQYAKFAERDISTTESKEG